MKLNFRICEYEIFVKNNSKKIIPTESSFAFILNSLKSIGYHEHKKILRLFLINFLLKTFFYLDSRKSILRELMAKKIVLTGATGTIGKKLYKALIKKGYEVTIFTRSLVKGVQTIPGADEFIEWDYRKKNHWQEH